MPAPASPIVVPRQITPLTAQQLQQFDDLLGSAQPALEQLLLRLRLLVDEELAPSLPFYGEKPYPLGRCLEIRDAVFTRLGALLNGKFAPEPGDEPVVRQLRLYLATGGLCQKVWGSLRRIYFQNAIQLGPWYVDVANDTVVVTKPKIEILLMASSGFANIDNYLHFAEVARAYWHVDIYANTVFPALAPLFPLVCASPKEGAWLAAGYEELIELTRRDAFAPSEAALRALPPVPAALREWFAARRDAAEPLLNMAGDPIEACRVARAQGMMHSREFRQAAVAAYRALPRR